MSDHKISKFEDAADAEELNDSDLESVSGGAGLTFGREKLKGTTSTQGDFNLNPQPPPPPTGLKIS